MLSACYNYNHIFVLIASVGLFLAFSHITLKEGAFSRFVCRIAPYTLGVYLLHCHTALDERWQQWIFAITGRPDSAGSLLLGILLAVLWLFWGIERAFSGIRGGQQHTALRGDKDGNEEK